MSQRGRHRQPWLPLYQRQLIEVTIILVLWIVAQGDLKVAAPIAIKSQLAA
jgi:hypothetical protein